MEFIKPGININFVGARKFAYGFSILLLLLAIILLVAKGGPNYGVDFAGGALVQVKFNKATTTQAVREAMTDLGFAKAEIQTIGPAADNEFLIRNPEEGGELEGLSQNILAGLEQKIGKGSVEIRRVEMVGPKVGKDLRQKALFAIFYSILFIVIYISGRFEMKWLMSAAVAAALMLAAYLATMLGAGVTGLIILALAVTIVICFVFQLRYALGAIISLIHDIAIVVGVMTLFDREMSLTVVAALLTILGYSLNDTIIVYDRIRENLRKESKKSFLAIINQSVNETLSRTILTSGTTLVVVIILMILGGPVIFDFALAMTAGIVIGTFSSIYVASPILLFWPPQGGKPLTKVSKAPVKNGDRRKKSKKAAAAV